MEVRCDKCQARYRIDDARVGPQGLAMRCGKCGNTFRAARDTPAPAAMTVPAPSPVAAAKPPAAAPSVTKPPAATPSVTKPPAATSSVTKPLAGAPPATAVKQPSAVAPPVSAAQLAPASGATVMFAAPTKPIPPPAPTARTAPSSPPPPASPPRAVPARPTAAKPSGAAAAAAVVAPLADEAAGRTMMFNAATALKAPAPARSAEGTVKPLSKPTDASGATLVFGASPALPQPPAPAPLAEVDGAAPTAAASASVQDKPGVEGTGEAVASEPLARDASEEQSSETELVADAVPGRGPPRALVIAVAAALATVLLLAGVVFAVKKLGHRSPPLAALEVLADARAAAEKDTLASLAEAEAQANAAIQVAATSRFPQGYAELAEIEIAWADALEDQAWYWGEKANRALAAGDDKKKAEAEARAIALQDAAKARLKTAFEAAAAGNKMDPKSAEVALALADYYRAAHSRVNLNRELKRAGLLKANDARIAFVQGKDLAAQDDATPRAVEKLRAALAASPRDARIRFRIAQTYLAAHQDAEAKKELLATLEVSPQHERARMAMELLAPAAPAGAEGRKE
jgi:predicted Zn finger-like uncharacterized protein